MGKNSTYRKDPPPKKKQIHPIWRGIGFIMIILIPIISYAAALLIFQENLRYGWFPIPADLIMKWSDPYLLIKIVLTLLVMFVLYMILLLLTFVINSLFGPSRYGPLDVEPTQYRGRTYKR